MNAVLVDLTGRTFGRLKVIERDMNKKRHAYWLCECSCGNPELKSVRGTHLTNERIKSCGCLYYGRIKEQNKTQFKKLPMYSVGIVSGNEFIFDTKNWDIVTQHNWIFDKDGYVVSYNNGDYLKLHRLVVNAPDNMKVDHKNLDKSDNRNFNLRTCNNTESSINIGIKKNNQSGVAGVGWHNGKWRARISKNHKEIYLGNFDIFEDAVSARYEAEKKLFGEFRNTENDKNILKILKSKESIYG